VVTQPDRRRGRGSALLPSPVKARALELGLPVFTPGRIRREPELQQRLADLGADVSVVVAFGQILPPEVLAQPPMGCWNGHGSLLPRWRGAAPIQWALIEGDTETGVGVMAMEAGLDTGPVLLESRVAIGLLENATELAARLAALTGELLVEALPRIEAAGTGSEADRLERLMVRPQSEVGATLARQLGKDDFRIDWSGSALEVHRRVMGLHPGSATQWRGHRMKLLATEPLVRRLADQLTPRGADLAQRWGVEEGSDPPAEPGTVLAIEPDAGLVVATGGCPLLIQRAQLEGKAASEAGSLVQQLGARPGDRLG
jgi:methionyl-tRNA formyltransferase